MGKKIVSIKSFVILLKEVYLYEVQKSANGPSAESIFEEAEWLENI